MIQMSFKREPGRLIAGNAPMSRCLLALRSCGARMVLDEDCLLYHSDWFYISRNISISDIASSAVVITPDKEIVGLLVASMFSRRSALAFCRKDIIFTLSQSGHIVLTFSTAWTSFIPHVPPMFRPKTHWLTKQVHVQSPQENIIWLKKHISCIK